MSKARTGLVAVIMAIALIVFGGAPLLKGAFYLGKHEGDAMHLADLVLRMVDGQWPHLDFMTPIGVLAIAPIAIFVKAGAGLGHAIFYAQILVALILFVPALYVAKTRLTGVWPYVYGAFVMLLCLALVHGEAQSAISISMHYNRWAWAVAYVIIPLALIEPAGPHRPWLDGALIGVGLAVLVLMKVTYFAALAPGILVALLARKNGRAVLAAVLSGLIVAAVMTAFAGVEFWLAYLKDLLTVAGSEARQAPGESFTNVVAAPLYMGGSLALVAGVIFLRQAGRMAEGLALLVLMPGFFYIAYQNFGNDPQWLYLLMLLVFVLRPDASVTNGFGWNMRTALSYVGALALAFGAPSALNLAFSPFRHLATDTEDTAPLLPALAVHHDLRTLAQRLYTANAKYPYDGPGEPYAAYHDFAKRPDPATLNGETLPECQLEGGMTAWFELVTADLEKAGFGGSRLIATDLYSAYWMFGDFKSVKGAAPWYYGGLPGVENADYIVVPLCPMALSLRAQMLKALEEGGWVLHEVRRTELYILIEARKP
jgi:hypothetical protein